MSATALAVAMATPVHAQDAVPMQTEAAVSGGL